MSTQKPIYSEEFRATSEFDSVWNAFAERVPNARHFRIHLESKSVKRPWNRCAPGRGLSRMEMIEFIKRGEKIGSTFRLSYLIPAGS